MKKKKSGAARSVLKGWMGLLLAAGLGCFIFGAFTVFEWTFYGNGIGDHLLSVVILSFFLLAITCWIFLEVNTEQEQKLQALEAKLEALTQPEEPPQADTPEEQ